MSVPKKRRTSSSKGRRQSHHALTLVKLIACKKCKKPVMAHRVCPSCGTYQGREVIKIKTKTKKER